MDRKSPRHQTGIRVIRHDPIVLASWRLLILYGTPLRPVSQPLLDQLIYSSTTSKYESPCRIRTALLFAWLQNPCIHSLFPARLPYESTLLLRLACS